MKSKYFNVGKIVATKRVFEKMMDNKAFAKEVNASLEKYVNKDWGVICCDDKAENNEALNYPDDIYLLGAYDTSIGKIWIITNRISEKAGDNATTIMFPDER